MTTVRQISFSGGEIAPSLYSRVDTVKYATGLRTCRNWIVKKQGGIDNRPGTQFVGEVADSTKRARMIPFIFNSDQAYFLECQVQTNTFKVRPYFEGAPIFEASKAITAITNANPALLTIVAHGYTNNDEIYISGIVGMDELNNQFYTVTVVNANQIRIRRKDAALGSGTLVNSVSFGTYTSGGTAEKIYQIQIAITGVGDDTEIKNIRYAQNADTLVLAWNPYYPLEIRRLAHDSWTIASFDFGPIIGAPSITGIAGGGGAGANAETYVATAVDRDSREESLVSAAITGSRANVPSTANPWTITVLSSSSAEWERTVEYRIYKQENGVYGFIGTLAPPNVYAANTFTDDGIEPDILETPPIDTDYFAAGDDAPTAVGFYQQALLFSNTNNAPERSWKSRTGSVHNFTTRIPLHDDDPMLFQIFGDRINPIQHLIQLKKLLMMTIGGEWSIEGDDSGTLKPTAINPRQHSYNGSRTIRPLIVNDTVLYVQARGSIIRDLAASIERDGYVGDDLTIFSAHLFEGKELVDWDFQKNPHSIVWVARSDGTLLGVTFIPEQQMLAWHRHDFENGLVENVCVVPEDDQDVLYLIIKRTIDGVTKRYIEKLTTRLHTSLQDHTILDSCLSYDGRNTDVLAEMFISDASGGYDAGDTANLNYRYNSLVADFFTSDDVGNAIYLTGSDGGFLKFTITAFISTSQVTGTFDRTVPLSLRFPHLTSTWSKAIDEISNLFHLEGESVSVLGDGFVIASPKNSITASLSTLTVTDGVITLPEPRAVIHVGIPITADVETLNIESADGPILTGTKKNITHVIMQVDSSAPFFIGGEPPADDDVDALSGMRRVELELEDDDPDIATELVTEDVIQSIQSHWDDGGRVFIRQVDPLPVSILSILPQGYIGAGGK